MLTFTITNKNRPKATVVMLVSLYGKQYKRSIGVGVPMKYWNAVKKRAKVTADFDGNPINDEIDRWEEIGKRVVKYFTELRVSPSAKEFGEKITELSEIREESPNDEKRYFADYFEYTYIPRYKGVRGIDTLKIYNTVLHKLREFKKCRRHRLTFDDINIDFYNRFQEWFYSQGFSRNYFGNVVKDQADIQRG